MTILIYKGMIKMTYTLAIIGGSQEKTYKTVGAKLGCKIIFHPGKVRNGGVKSDFRKLVKNSDCVVMLYGALGHVSMDVVKELCKELDKPMAFQKNYGASGAIKKGLATLTSAA